MKSIVSVAALAALFTFSIGCQPQNKPAPAPAPPPPVVQKDTMPAADESEKVEMMAVEISGGAPIVPNPRTVASKVEMRKDGDLIPVFITQTEDGGGKPKAVCSFSLTSEGAIKAIGLLRKIGEITQKSFDAKSKMVGSGPKYFSVTRDGVESARLTVQLGAVADPSMIALEKLVADEMADYREAKSGIAGKTQAFLEGKVWQSDTDPNRRISVREGRFVTFNKSGEEPAKAYVSMRRHCADGCGRMTKKTLAEGMKAGFICCMTLTAQDDECFLILDAEGKKLELIGTNENSKSEHYTLLMRK